jgi:CheY-like chemotaxis protein
VTAALSADGAESTRVSSVGDAAEVLGKFGFDAIILSHPLPDADVIGSCATLAQVPGAPPIVLLDVIDATSALESTVPSEMRPKQILKKPIDATKLAQLIRELVEIGDVGAEAAEPSFDELTRLLVELNRGGKTGTLEVRADGVVTRVHFQNGLAIGAEGGSLRETLGRMLLRKKALSEEDYVHVIERMTEQVIDNEHLRMGEVLVEFGLLSSEEVHAALSEQVAEKITACFQWRNAEFEFEEMDEPPPGVEGFDIPPIETLVLRGLKLYVPPDEISAALRKHHRKRVLLSRPAAEITTLFQIENTGTQTLALLDGSRTLDGLLAGGDHVWLLAALVWTGNARLADERKPAAKAQDTRRGRSEFAREVVMPRKKEAARRRPAPDEPSTKPVVDESKAKLAAEQLFRRAEASLSAEKFSDAVKAMAQAVELQPNEPEYRMVEAWALYLQARVDVRVARAKAVACARRVSEADPQAAKPHGILGRLALDDGDNELASREFQAALVRDPEDEQAQRGMKRSGRQT